MAVSLRVLTMREEALGDDKMQIIFCTGHCDVKQPALLLDLGSGAGAEVGGNAAVNDVQHED